MNRRVYRMLLLAACLLAFGVTTVALWWPQLTASEEVSDLYRRYADDGHLDVAFIRGFRVNDTLRLDVTTLQARDSVGWERLLKDFNMTPPPSEVIEICGKDFIEMRLAPKNDYSGRRDTVLLNNDFIATSWYEKTIWVFVIETEEQYSAVFLNQVDESINRSLTQK